jgi:hypothetical protein
MEARRNETQLREIETRVKTRTLQKKLFSIAVQYHRTRCRDSRKQARRTQPLDDAAGTAEDPDEIILNSCSKNKHIKAHVAGDASEST